MGWRNGFWWWVGRGEELGSSLRVVFVSAVRKKRGENL